MCQSETYKRNRPVAGGCDVKVRARHLIWRGPADMAPEIMVRARYKGLCPRAKVRARESSGQEVRARHLIWRGPADMALEIMVREVQGVVSSHP